MNALLQAWETTVEDVENVLGKMGEDVALAPEIFNELDCEDVAKAALQSTDFDEQVEGAYNEIQRQIPEICARLY
ncbi:Uncharacterised protein [uncultured archaeon]|nr:Uncharacterised protein [uncultured archaeon]